MPQNSAKQPSPDESPAQRLVELACALFRTPIGLLSVFGEEKTAFRAIVGLDATSIASDVSVTRMLVAEGPGAVMVVEDSHLDERVRNHPLVTGPEALRFYAGATVSDRQGRAVGSIGVMDRQPRGPLDETEIVNLRRLAAMAGDMVDGLTEARAYAEKLETLELAEAMAGVGHFRLDAQTGRVSWSDEVFRIHGLEPGAVDPTLHTAIGAYHPGDAEIIRGLVARALETGEGYDARLRLTRADGGERVTRAKASCERDENGVVTALFGVFQDITESVRVHDRLAQSEALFRLMSETSTDIVARFDAEGRFLYVSPSAKAVLGRDPEAMLGKDCTGIIVEDDLGMIRQTLQDYVAKGPGAPSPRYEYRAIKADGSLVWLEATPRAIRDDAGQVVEFQDHVRDITARKAAEREQAELVETLRLAESIAGIGHWQLDVASGKVTWSEQVYRIHGVSPDSFDPSLDDAVGFYHPDDQEQVRAWVAKAIETGETDEFRLRLIRADGEERVVISQCVPERDERGVTTALFGVFKDETDSIRTHDRVAASETRYRLLADNATDIIATYGMDGVFRYVSPAIEGPMGYRPEDLVGQPFWRFMHADDVRAVRAAFSVYAQAGPGATSPRVPYRGLRKDGTTVWLEAHPKVIRDAQGRAVEFLDVVRDVSDTKALEDQLIASRDVAEAGARAKSEFLANMSHELRTPLTSVIGFSGLLQASQNLPEAERRYADRIGTASEALLSVINDILDYSKLEAEAVDLDPQAFDPRAMAEGAVAIVEAQCRDKGLTLETIIDPGLPPAVMGDEGRLRQVALNFLSNAVKFTATGAVRLAMTAVDGRLRLAVTDSGIGIAPEKIEALFDRFTQADASTTRVYGGTGLGLAISRRLVEMMGGEIGAESRAGEGATFWFEVPLVEATEAAEGADDGELRVADSLKILMADDAAPNRELVTAILGGLGLGLETVCNGAEAVEAARTGGYDVILMDVHMPVMDGLDATRAIRAMGGDVGRTPIIALTANVQPEQVQRCREAGMDAHVGKPIQLSELLNALAAASECGRAEETGPADTARVEAGRS